MLNMKVSTAVNEIVEAMLPRGTQGKLLYIHVDASLSDYSGSKEKNSRKSIHFIFSRTSNYTTVGVAVNTNWGFPRDCDIKFKSSHDSCWRTDGVDTPLSEVYHQMWKEVNPKKHPKELSSFVTFKKIQLIDGTMMVDRKNDYKIEIVLT